MSLLRVLCICELGADCNGPGGRGVGRGKVANSGGAHYMASGSNTVNVFFTVWVFVVFHFVFFQFIHVRMVAICCLSVFMLYCFH